MAGGGDGREAVAASGSAAWGGYRMGTGGPDRRYGRLSPVERDRDQPRGCPGGRRPSARYGTGVAVRGFSEGLGETAAGDLPCLRRASDSRPAFSAPGREQRRQACGGDFFPWGLAAADAAGVSLSPLLLECVFDESVSGEPRICGIERKLSQRDRLRAEFPGGFELRELGRQRVQRRDGGGSLYGVARRCRSAEDRRVGRIVRRLSHRDGAGAGEQSVRGGRGYAWGA